MEAKYYLTCLWPGLAELWWRGRLSALPLAVGFTLAVNAVLVTRYIYPEWMAGGLVAMAFWFGLLGWGFMIVRSIRELPEIVHPRSVSDEPDRFPAAHAAYLQAQYERAEQLLKALLAIEPRDPPALLLLTGVYRHTGRLPAAEALLKEISRLEVADHWQLEVLAETRRLRAALDQAEQAEQAVASETGGEQAEQAVASETGGEQAAAADLASPDPRAA